MSKNPPKETLAPQYFEDIYDAHDDPWNFATSDYEAEKYAATIAALPHRHYDSAFEIGCSIGVLTARLAPLCKRLLSVDVNEKAIAQARERCRRMPQVRFEKIYVPKEFPAEDFDLIIVSEVGYYLSAADWKKTQEKITGHLRPEGIVVLVHWTHFVHDYPQNGNDIHESFAKEAAGKFRHLHSNQTPDYRLDVWERKISAE